MALTPELRSQRARVAAYSRWARYDAREGTQAARDAFHQRFIEQVDPTGELPPAERERRATAAMKAYMASLSFKSAKARSKRAEK